MARKFHLVGGSPGRENHPVPTVDPADLKSVWATQDEIQALYPGSRSMIAIGFCANACSPGADVRAIFLRVSMLRMLQMLSESGGLISPWLHEGKPDDAAFKVVATVPMTGLQLGVPSGGFPVDAEELIALIKKESEA
jgi:hypothetical protein